MEKKKLKKASSISFDPETLEFIEELKTTKRFKNHSRSLILEYIVNDFKERVEQGVILQEVVNA